MQRITITILLLLCSATVLFSQNFWYSRTSGTTNTLYAVSYSALQLCVAVGSNGGIYTSPYKKGTLGLDTWTSRISGTTNTLNTVYFGLVGQIFTQYVAAGNNGEILTSADGITWTHRTSGTTRNLNSITYDHSALGCATVDQYVVVGDSGTILTSLDGITWTSRISGITDKLNGVDCFSCFYVAVGNSGTILTSPDGITWTSRVSGTKSNLYSVACTYQKVTAVGDSGTILTSSDGVTWITRNIGTSYYLKDITGEGGQYVTVGKYSGVESGLNIMTSSDCNTWRKQISLTEADTEHSLFNGIAYGNNAYVAVGDSGKMMVATGLLAFIKSKADYPNNSLCGKTMQIYTLQGKLISQNKIESDNYFDGKSALYKNLSKGMYIVRIPTGNAVISRRVFVE